jgi:hypothetical protein
MSLADLTSRPAVLAAVREFDRLGREAFLATHNFGKARRYYLSLKGGRYDSKAIAGVAHGYQFPREGALDRRHFSGGEKTVRRQLEAMGFRVVVMPRGRRIRKRRR